MGDQRLDAAVERKRRAMARPRPAGIRAMPHAPARRSETDAVVPRHRPPPFVPVSARKRENCTGVTLGQQTDMGRGAYPRLPSSRQRARRVPRAALGGRAGAAPPGKPEPAPGGAARGMRLSLRAIAAATGGKVSRDSATTVRDTLATIAARPRARI